MPGCWQIRIFTILFVGAPHRNLPFEPAHPCVRGIAIRDKIHFDLAVPDFQSLRQADNCVTANKFIWRIKLTIALRREVGGDQIGRLVDQLAAIVIMRRFDGGMLRFV